MEKEIKKELSKERVQQAINVIGLKKLNMKTISKRMKLSYQYSYMIVNQLIHNGFVERIGWSNYAFYHLTDEAISKLYKSKQDRAIESKITGSEFGYLAENFAEVIKTEIDKQAREIALDVLQSVFKTVGSNINKMLPVER